MRIGRRLIALGGCRERRISVYDVSARSAFVTARFGGRTGAHRRITKARRLVAVVGRRGRGGVAGEGGRREGGEDKTRARVPHPFAYQ